MVNRFDAISGDHGNRFKVPINRNRTKDTFRVKRPAFRPIEAPASIRARRFLEWERERGYTSAREAANAVGMAPDTYRSYRNAYKTPPLRLRLAMTAIAEGLDPVETGVAAIAKWEEATGLGTIRSASEALDIHKATYLTMRHGNEVRGQATISLAMASVLANLLPYDVGPEPETRTKRKMKR